MAHTIDISLPRPFASSANITLALAVDASVGGVEFRGTFVGGLFIPGMTNPLFFRMSAGIIAGAGLRLDE